MFEYIVKRFFQGLLLIFIVSIITFLILKVIPADPATLILGTEASAENIESLRVSMGLNRPYYVQYIEWIGNALKGDLGNSYYFGKSVKVLISERLPTTFLLATVSTVITFIISMLLGVWLL
jgi:peptide/nickel transport system permease protein